MRVNLQDHGTLVAFNFDEEGKTWADENLQTEPWQWLGPHMLMVGHREAESLAHFIQSEGVEVRVT